VAALAVLGSMRAVSATGQLVVMPDRVELAERVVQLARLARTLRRCLAVLAVSAVTLGSLVVARWVRAAWMEHRHRAAEVLAALVERAARVAMLVLAALAAMVLPGRASAVVWASRASAALVAVAALAALGSMRAVSATGQLVVMPDRAALVERAALLARLARTLRRCLVVMAEPAVMLAQQVRARWV
jgi:hypothetical protein